MKKPVLGIETSGKSTALALVDSGQVIAQVVEDSDCGHNEILMPLLDRLLRDADVGINDIAGIGVDVGPGMFTSLRVGVSTAKGLAIARKVPVVGIGSLWALAGTASAAFDGVLSVVDARKQQVYAAIYVGGAAVFAPSVIGPADLAAEAKRVLSGRTSLIAAGSGTTICVPSLAAVGITLESAGIECPSPGIVALAAAERIVRGDADQLSAVEPLYLRRTDAEIVRERKFGKKS